MAEKVFDTIQLGRESVVGTEVNATTVYPGKSTGPDLDRGYLNPDEDYGIISDSYPGRASFGLRGSSSSIESPVRFEDIGHFLSMHLTAYDAPTGGGPYVYTWAANETSVTDVDTYTVEMGSEDALDQYTLTGCVVPELTLGFDDLTAPGNSPWTMSAQLEGFDRAIKAMTAGQSAPTGMETCEGHFTQLYEGTTSTAFASLVELSASLKMFRLTSNVPYVRRAYGAAASDKAVAWGLSGKGSATFEAAIKVGATAGADISDIYNFASAQVQERRWRIKINGSSLVTQNEIQVATVNGTPTGGTFTLTFNGVTTSAIAYNAAAADVQTALRALPTINGANCSVTGSAGGPYTVTFNGTLASTALPLMLASGAALTGGSSPSVTVAQSQAGGLLKSIVLDGRVRFNVVGRGDSEGESVYAVQGIYVYDATLGSRLQAVVTNNVATLP